VRQEAEVYYLQRRIFDGKFGSPEPYVFRDPDFGLVNLRLFGAFRWHVAQPELFINQFVGTFGAVTTPAVDARLRDQMVLLVYAALGQLKDQGMRVTDLAMRLETIEQAVLGLAPTHFGPLGVEVLQLQGLSVNLPEEVQRAVDTRAGMSVLGVNYMQYQTGQAITTAAANPSGGAGTLAGAGVGLGAGLGMGYGVASTLGGTAGGATPCPRCAALVPAGTRFCPSCGTALAGAASPPGAPASAPAGPVCPKCQSPNAPGARFCNNCGASLGAAATRACPRCQAPNAAGAKFCSNCGASLGG
jgi:membrane protease subunit (stomatin/prohibitin family)